MIPVLFCKEFIIKYLYDVKLSPKAGLRTKHRIREHGPIFRVAKFDVTDGVDVGSVLLRSESTGWLVWFPVRELELHIADGN